MSKKPSTKIIKLKYQSTNNLPALKDIKTSWDLASHYYQSEDDLQLEVDAKKFEQTVKAFIKKYKAVDFTESAESLLSALEAEEKIEEMSEVRKIMLYFGYRSVLNANDTVANRKSMQYAERFRKLSNEALFFTLKIGKISKEKQREYLSAPSLKKYHYYLVQAFEDAKYHLTEAEEKILNLCHATSVDLWENATEKTVSNRAIVFKKMTYHLPEALELIDNLSWQDKSILWAQISTELAKIAEFSEHELTALVSHHKVQDELRGFKKPYSASFKAYENDEKSVLAMTEAVTDKGFALSNKFYQLKAKLHGQKTIPYVNKYDSIGDLPKPDFATSVEICRDALYTMDTAFGSIFDRLVENGQIDAFPKKGKRGGAFMQGGAGVPTYVMLNHLDNFKSLETLAHEVGHAIHTELSKNQPSVYQDYSLCTAETASTLFEQFVLKFISQQMTEEQKVVFLHDKLSRGIATVQRQTAFFNFELEMHQHIREHGVATREELAEMMAKHLKSYLGPAVEVTTQDGYTYVIVTQFRSFFYVYTYAYGYLASNLMLQKYAQDPSFINQINQFLHAGGSDNVENIFSSIGIKTRKVETFIESLKTQEQDIIELEKLTKRLKL